MRSSPKWSWKILKCLQRRQFRGSINFQDGWCTSSTMSSSQQVLSVSTLQSTALASSCCWVSLWLLESCQEHPHCELLHPNTLGWWGRCLAFHTFLRSLHLVDFPWRKLDHMTIYSWINYWQVGLLLDQYFQITQAHLCKEVNFPSYINRERDSCWGVNKNVYNVSLRPHVMSTQWRSLHFTAHNFSATCPKLNSVFLWKLFLVPCALFYSEIQNQNSESNSQHLSLPHHPHTQSFIKATHPQYPWHHPLFSLYLNYCNTLLCGHINLSLFWFILLPELCFQMD